MAAFRHIRFLKVRNFNCAYPSDDRNAPPCQIMCRSVKPLRRYGLFRFSRWRPSTIVDFYTLEILTLIPFGWPKCVIVQNFLQIGQGVAEIWPFSIFQDSGRPPSSICYTPVCTTHEVYFGGVYHCAKFGLNRCSIVDNMQVLITDDKLSLIDAWSGHVTHY